MASRTQNIFRRLRSSPSMASAGTQHESEIPNFTRLGNTLPPLPRFAVYAPQSETIQPPRATGRVCRSYTLDEEEDMIPLESDSDSDVGSEEDVIPLESEYADVATSEGKNPSHHASPIGATPVVFTDPDVLDCPICLEPLRSPIYQCENGHIACSPCCTNSNHKCHSCCLPIGFNRCRAMEKVIDSVKVECQNKKYGCRESMIYHMKAEHEQTCVHTLCYCPEYSSCGFANSFKNLYKHFQSHHSSCATLFAFDTAFHIGVGRGEKCKILQERNEGVMFILNHEVKEHGRVFNVDCLGSNMFNNGFVYQISVRCLETCFSMESVAEVCTKWEEHSPNKSYLTIPSEYLEFSILVCIKKAYQVV